MLPNDLSINVIFIHIIVMILWFSGVYVYGFLCDAK